MLCGRRRTLALAVLVVLGAWAGEALAQRPEAPVNHPLYERVRLLGTASSPDAQRELITGALPALESACRERGDAACADWARGQRTLRAELAEARAALAACWMWPGADHTRYVAQRVLRAEYALAGRDLDAEERTAKDTGRRAWINELRSATMGLLEVDREQVDVASLEPWADRVRRAAVAVRSDAALGAHYRPTILAAEALAAAWSAEASVDWEYRELSRYRDRTRADYARRRSEVLKLDLDIAEQNLAHAGSRREQARKDTDARREHARGAMLAN